MSTVSLQIELDAPPQVVWDTIMDPERLHEWVSIHRSVKQRSDDWPLEGAQIDQVLNMRGVSFKVRWTLESVRAPKEATWHGRGPALSKALISYRLTGDAEGPTTFYYENEFHAPGGHLGQLAQRVVVGHIPEQEAQETLTRLKALLERH